MRFGGLVAVSALVLAACSGADQGGNALPVDETTPEVATAAPLPDIPARFRGTFDADLAACDANVGDMRLVIDAREMRFHESAGRVTRVSPRDADAVDVDVVSTGEGITEQRQYRLALDEGGQLNVTVSGSESSRVRCDTPELAHADAAALNLLARSGKGSHPVDPDMDRKQMIAG